MRFALALPLLFAGALAAPALPQSTPLDAVLIAGGLAKPLWVGQCPGETDPTRLFVVEQSAADIHILLNGVIQEPPFLDMTPLAKVKTTNNEQGLLGLAFHPDFQNNGWFYVYYTQVGTDDIMIERCTVIGTPATATAADITTFLPILGPVVHPQTNHNGGNIAFGPDGKLYAGIGDGGNFNDQGTGHVAGGNAQSGTTLLGKMIRINDDGSIPGDNPFSSPSDGIMDAIWHFGMRNPWRWSFDAETGDMWIGDVGQDAREEVDFQPAGQGGKNYGWRCMEGFQCTGLSGCVCNSLPLTLPVHDYSHGTGGICSVTGGYVYRGSAIPDLAGTYFFADYCGDQIWSFEYDGVTMSGFQNRAPQLDPPGTPAIASVTSFGVDNKGELYICDQAGEIWKVVSGNAFTGLGNALAGAAGKPVLWGDGSFGPGGNGIFHLANAAPSANALLFVGLVEGAVAFKGGILVPVPFLLSLNVSTNPSGVLDLPYFVDPVIPAGTAIYFQYAIQDAGAPNGVALSNALKGVTTP